MTFKDAIIHEMLMPLSPLNEANKTANVLMAVDDSNRTGPDTFTNLDQSRSGGGGKSQMANTGKNNQDTYVADNSTLQSPNSDSREN